MHKEKNLTTDLIVRFICEVLVPGAGIEPALLSEGDFESPASTNFTTRATL